MWAALEQSLFALEFRTSKTAMGQNFKLPYYGQFEGNNLRELAREQTFCRAYHVIGKSSLA